MRILILVAAIALCPVRVLSADSLLLAEGREGVRPFQRAAHLKNQGKTTEALAALDEAERRHGPHPDIFVSRAEIALSKGDLGGARATIGKALRLKRDHRSAIALDGRLKGLAGDAAGARRDLVRLERLCAFGCAQERELRRWLATPRS